MPPVIHVAGTNGKGSTIAFMRAMLEAAGRSVHVYTSPHLVRFNERFRLGAGDAGVRRGARRRAGGMRARQRAASRSPCSRSRPRPAFLLFSRNPADVLLLEVGLGGRLDATNVIDQPLASVITPVSMDHLEFLGDTLEKIAAEKAAILKRGVPAVIAPQPDAAMAVIERQAREGCARRCTSPASTGTCTRSTAVWSIRTRTACSIFPRRSSTAATSSTMPASPSRRCARPASSCRTPRMRPASSRPTGRRACSFSRSGALKALAPPDSELWLDGGHNAEGGRAVAAAIGGLEERVSRPLVLIVGMLATKDCAGYLRNFAGLARRVFAIPIPDQEKSLPAEAVAQAARNAGIPAERYATIEEALAATSRLELDPRAAHPDRRLALSRRRSAGEERHAAGLKLAVEKNKMAGLRRPFSIRETLRAITPRC